MKQAELLTAVQQSRAALETALAGLTPEQLTTPGVIENWTIKDVLAHLTAWEVAMVTNLGKAQRGQTPKVPQWTDATRRQQNEQWWQEYQTRPLERVLADWQGVRKQTLRLLEATKEAELAAPLKWWQKHPLWAYIHSNTAEHEAKHTQAILTWRQQHNL